MNQHLWYMAITGVQRNTVTTRCDDQLLVAMLSLLLCIDHARLADDNSL